MTKTINQSKKLLPGTTFLRANLTHLLNEILLPEKKNARNKARERAEHGKGQSGASRRGRGFSFTFRPRVTQANLFMLSEIMDHSEKVQHQLAGRVIPTHLGHTPQSIHRFAHEHLGNERMFYPAHSRRRAEGKVWSHRITCTSNRTMGPFSSSRTKPRSDGGSRKRRREPPTWMRLFSSSSSLQWS